MHEIVQDYYGKQLQSSADLKTSACCDVSMVPEWLKPLLARIHPEVLERYYGCGLVCPDLLQGRRVLDLGHLWIGRGPQRPDDHCPGRGLLLTALRGREPVRPRGARRRQQGQPRRDCRCLRETAQLRMAGAGRD